jgi:hypothetical protein
MAIPKSERLPKHSELKHIVLKIQVNHIFVYLHNSMHFDNFHSANLPKSSHLYGFFSQRIKVLHIFSAVKIWKFIWNHTCYFRSYMPSLFYAVWRLVFALNQDHWTSKLLSVFQKQVDGLGYKCIPQISTLHYKHKLAYCRNWSNYVQVAPYLQITLVFS